MNDSCELSNPNGGSVLVIVGKEYQDQYPLYVII